MKPSIVPAILAGSKDEFEFYLNQVRGLVNRVQVDIIDGKFFGKKTIEPMCLVDFVDWGIDFELHLMVDEPELWVPKCQIDGVVALVAQIEMMKEVYQFVEDTQYIGVEVGLAVDIETGVDRVERYVSEIDKVLLMSVPAGEQGREFDERVLEKIGEVRRISRGVKVEIDGGLDEEQIKLCLSFQRNKELGDQGLRLDFGSLEFVVGSALWKAEDLGKKLEILRNLEVS